MKTNLSFEQQTQAFSTWGDKLLQHADRLSLIQNQREFRPITVQLAPTEACDSDCPWCSVQSRPIRDKIQWQDIAHGMEAFARLGAKSVEITGGGNPLLYRDGSQTINHVVELCHLHGLKIGIITNTEKLSRHLDIGLADKIQWVRVSLRKLDEGKNPSDYDFSGFEGKVGLSYIVDETTTPETIRRIAEVVDLNPHTKFVRIAPNCLTEDSLTIKEKWGQCVSEMDSHGKMFIKEIGGHFKPYEHGCFVGMIRPYWVSSGVYICTSHVLKHRTYHPTWRLCGHREIESKWMEMNQRFKSGLAPYEIDIKSECWHCYYGNNNKILSTVASELPDKEFA